MKTISTDELKADLARYLSEAQEEAIVITHQGKPCAVLHGVSGDLESAERSHSAEFWQMIEGRRREPTVPWEQVKKDLGLNR